MRPDQVLLAILAVVVLANVLLVALIPLRTFALRRSTQPEPFPQPDTPEDRFQPVRPAVPRPPVARPRAGEPSGPGLDHAASTYRRADEDARAAAAIEAFVADVSADSDGRTQAPAIAELTSRGREVVAGTSPEARATPPRAMDRREGDSREPSTLPMAEPRFRGPEPLGSGLADPATWARTLREESARVARFGRPVTVVMAELPQLDGVADRLGRDAADQVINETARMLVTEGRAADRIAWLGGARFGVLLLETEEARARGYVDRVRAVADGWLESAGLSVRLSLGWASPADGGDVMTAAASAQQRMHDVDRRSPPGATPIFGD